MIDVHNIESEETAAVQNQVNERVVARLQSLRGDAVAALETAQADLAALDSEIASRSPQPEASEENAEG